MAAGASQHSPSPTATGRVPTGGAAPAAASEFQFRDVSQYFLGANDEPFLAVKDINLSFEAGRFVSIIGPSGCGKSTLLNMAAGLMRPTIGEVLYRGEPISGVNTSVGYITQQDHLLPWRSVAKNVGIALEVQHTPAAERRERVERVLELVGLSGFEHSYPPQLSGGMRKRAALARVLIYDPDTLLMDEPFGALDAQLRLVMQRELLALWERDKKTVLFVTHDLEEAILLADEVVVFGTKPGRIIHVEHVDLPRPRKLTELRSDPEFTRVWTRLWSLIEGQLSEGPADESDGGGGRHG